MTDFIKTSEPSILKGAIQALLEGKRHARDLENFIDGVLPLVKNEEYVKKLEEARENAAKAAYLLQQLYTRNAREAFGDETK